MNHIRPKPYARLFVSIALIAGWCAGSCLLLGGDPPESGNKIQFTDPKDGFHIPLENPKDELDSRPFEFLDRRDSLSGVITPNLGPTFRATPDAAMSSRMIELYQRRLDEKKNWIYQKSDSSRSDPTIEERFGIRDRDNMGYDHRTKGVVAEFFERSERRAPHSKAPDDLKDRLDRAGAFKTFEEKFGDGKKLETFNDAMSDEKSLIKREFSIQNGFVAPEPIRPDGALDPKFRQISSQERNSEPRNDDFRKLLITQTGVNPLAPGFDPINLNVDATRQQLNPISPLGMETPSIGALSTELTPGDASGASRISGLLGSGASIAGPSSLSPAVAGAVGSRVQHQPVVLEFPKRKL